MLTGIRDNPPGILAVDTVKPAMGPLDLLRSSDTGRDHADELTRDATPSFGGKAEAHALIRVYDGGVRLGAARADAEGHWTFTAERLPDGHHTFTAVAFDKAGNRSAPTSALDIQIDTRPPPPPAAKLANDTGASHGDSITSDSHLQLSGLRAGCTVQYSDDGGATWSNRYQPEEGVNRILVRQVDVAGNHSAASDVLRFRLDSEAPAAPVITALADPAGAITGTVSNFGTIRLAGTAVPGVTVTIEDTGVAAGTAVSDSAGAWHIDLTGLKPGSHSFIVRLTDAAGNSAASEARGLTLTAPVIDLAALDATSGVFLRGGTGEAAGSDVSAAGDVNGDGFNDILIAAQMHNGGKGGAYLVYGSASGIAPNLSNQQIVELTALSAQQGVLLERHEAYKYDFAFFGSSVSAAGDINGDGFGDFVIGATSWEGADDQTGRAFIVFGTASGLGVLTSGQRLLDVETLTSAQGVILTNGSYTGTDIASAGDVDGDGFDDLLVVSGSDFLLGVHDANLVFGGTSPFGTITSGKDIVSLGVGEIYAADDASVTTVGDVNGDGIDDVIVGTTPSLGTGLHANGGALVIFGKDGAGEGSPAWSTPLTQSNLTAERGFIIRTSEAFGTGRHISGLGDIDGDGFADIGIDGLDSSYIIFGRDNGFGALKNGQRIIDLTDMPDSQGLRVSHGTGIASAGDFNGDGIDDFAVRGVEDVRVIFGKSTGFGTVADGHRVFDADLLLSEDGVIIKGAGTGLEAVSAAGDINADGYGDLIISARDSGGFTGAYVVYGGNASDFGSAAGHGFLA